MLAYQGKSAYSFLRQKRLLDRIQHKLPTVLNLQANFMYFFEVNRLSQEDHDKMIAIIDPIALPWQEDESVNIIFVTPRFGTQSPWSSKTKDILEVCGLSSINRVERGIVYKLSCSKQHENLETILHLLHDRMTEVCHSQLTDLEHLFSHCAPAANESIPLLKQGISALEEANVRLGLALSHKEIAYLKEQYFAIQRNPTTAELMMFAQVNSEHCRHKVFNAEWTINQQHQSNSLFDMIRFTYQVTNEGVLSAYKDNGAVIAGHNADHFFIDTHRHAYHYQFESAHIVIKVETHNHPTAIAPFEGAATGAGGEIRDEGATGIGAKPKAGLCGFSVSNLQIPKLKQPWEHTTTYPNAISSSLDIMLQGPIGAASFNNEFGRPTICGYFRTFEFNEFVSDSSVVIRGYHKPIMIAGGFGHIRAQALKKQTLPLGTRLIVLGGPAMLIGLGGGAASSLYSGGSQAELDFASVQRSNPEMQRRCQEVINACWALGEKNPIISIHDVGAGGLSNALPELVHDSDQGAIIYLDSIPTADSSLNAMQIWCNEAQERYVLAVSPANVAFFDKIATRERCPYAVIGEVNDTDVIRLHDSAQNENPVDLPLNILFGEASNMHREVVTKKEFLHKSVSVDLSLKECVERVLQLPCVASKSFLITIGDRSVGGLIARDQMVGPWQIPVADVGVTASGYRAYTGEAVAMGERSPIALVDACASARMAVAEAITNLLAADVQKLSDIKLSANWMAGVNYLNEDEKLYAAVHAVGVELCPALGICIPVGKDSLSMQMKWREDQVDFNVVSPVSLIVTAFAPVTNIQKTVTPLLETEGSSELLLIDLGRGKNRLGASALAQVTRQLGDEVPDLDDPSLLIHFFEAIKSLREKGLLIAYHDRSDGGLLVSLCEMAFAAHTGITLELDGFGEPLAALFTEELGAVIQYDISNKKAIQDILEQQLLLKYTHKIGMLNQQDAIIIQQDGAVLYKESRIHLQRIWSETSYHLQALRDDPACALSEYNTVLNSKDPGLHAHLTFDLLSTPPAILSARPKVAILREQGVNGHMEMAAAFERAGFRAVDVHMSDLIGGDVVLKQFQGMVACGGFSYGDVLGAGRGWANSILYNEKAREQLMAFFSLPSVFVLGVCNGCQMLSHLKSFIPGANHWPVFKRNTSEQFEARLSLVKIMPSPSLFFANMEDSILPIVVSHGEGRVEFEKQDASLQVLQQQLVSLQYVDHFDQITEEYPFNPNGSPFGIAALTNQDGRFTIMMPHVERVFRNVQFSWHPKAWQEENSPWFKFFLNARDWCKNV